MLRRLVQTVFSPYSLMIALAVVLFCGNAIGISRAEEALTETQRQIEILDEVGNLICQANMRAFIYDKEKEFNDFINTNFENKSSTASLSGNAFDKYKEFREALMDELEEYVPVEGQDQTVSATAFATCELIVDEALAKARMLIQRKAETTSAVKVTTAITDKYQEINDKLDALNVQFAVMKSYFDTFAQKIPCYIDICI